MCNKEDEPEEVLPTEETSRDEGRRRGAGVSETSPFHSHPGDTNPEPLSRRLRVPSVRSGLRPFRYLYSLSLLGPRPSLAEPD